MRHMWEEPFISGTNGSGMIFFSGCNMKCVFCQNFEISDKHKGKEISIDELVEIFKKLELNMIMKILDVKTCQTQLKGKLETS